MNDQIEKLIGEIRDIRGSSDALSWTKDGQASRRRYAGISTVIRHLKSRLPEIIGETRKDAVVAFSCWWGENCDEQIQDADDMDNAAIKFLTLPTEDEKQ